MNVDSKVSGLITDTVTLQSIRDFLASEKPSSLTPVDVLQIIHLKLRKAEDHDVFDSQQTLARAFACDTKTIVRSQKRLQKLEWLSRPQRKGRSNALSLNYENIPTEKRLRESVTAEAKKISVAYQRMLQQRGRKKFPKPWLSRQHLSAQRILDLCGGDLKQVGSPLLHALDNPRLRNKARKSLYEVRGIWPKIMASYAATITPQKTEDIA